MSSESAQGPAPEAETAEESYEATPTELEARASAQALEDAASRLHTAELAILSALEDEPLYPRDAQEAAQNGLPSDYLSLAFWDLVNRRQIELGSDRKARLVAEPEPGSSTS